MKNNNQSLWNQLSQAGIVSGVEPSSEDQHSPWFVRAMLIISGWIAALFLLGFVGVGFVFIIKSEVASLVFGLMAITGAYVIFRANAKSDFAGQFGIAASFAGQALVIWGLSKLLDTQDAFMWFVFMVLQVVLAVVLPNFIHRVWSAYAAAISLSMVLAINGVSFISAGIIAAVFTIVWMNEIKWSRMGSLIRPIGYGLAFALVQIEGSILFGHTMEGMIRGVSATSTSMPLWMGEVLSGVILIIVVWKLLDRHGERLPGLNAMVALAGTLMIGAVSVKATGIATALLIIVIGFAGVNRVLLGIGIASFLFYLSTYYYLLEYTLLVKSQILTVTGVILLSVRWMFSKWLLTDKGERHA